LLIDNDTTILVAGRGNSIKYKWTENPAQGTITCLDPPLCDSVRVIAPVTTTYTVAETDTNGCQAEQVLLVTIDIPCLDVKFPNVFTPDNAGALGLNNVFYIRTENIDAWSLIIFDRWGKEMYNSTNPAQYWNGNTEGGAKAPDGVYYYVLTATCQSTTYKKSGFVQLIR
jgi:gliding motility-associated-like protein